MNINILDTAEKLAYIDEPGSDDFMAIVESVQRAVGNECGGVSGNYFDALDWGIMTDAQRLMESILWLVAENDAAYDRNKT